MSVTHDEATELKVYGSAISYYTGKLEGYLRYKEIPYRFVTMSPQVSLRLARRLERSSSDTTAGNRSGESSDSIRAMTRTARFRSEAAKYITTPNERRRTERWCG